MCDEKKDDDPAWEDRVKGKRAYVNIMTLPGRTGSKGREHM